MPPARSRSNACTRICGRKAPCCCWRGSRPATGWRARCHGHGAFLQDAEACWFADVDRALEHAEHALLTATGDWMRRRRACACAAFAAGGDGRSTASADAGGARAARTGGGGNPFPPGRAGGLPLRAGQRLGQHSRRRRAGGRGGAASREFRPRRDLRRDGDARRGGKDRERRGGRALGGLRAEPHGFRFDCARAIQRSPTCFCSTSHGSCRRGFASRRRRSRRPIGSRWPKHRRSCGPAGAATTRFRALRDDFVAVDQ